MFPFRGLRLYFVVLEPWVPPFVPVYLCSNVGPRGLLPGHTACPVLRHSESRPLGLSARMWGGLPVVRLPAPLVPQATSLGPATATHKSSPPRLPVSAPPTGLDECLFFISLVLDFLAIRFSVSSGCARRRRCVYLCRHLGSPGLLKISFISRYKLKICLYFPFIVIFVKFVWC